jgi:hypothetical protein
MATGIAAAQANAILDAYCRSVAYSDPVGFFAKLHTGDPGASGTSNAATETTRKAVTFSAASGGAITNSASLDWTSVAATETYSHVSFWDTVGPAGGTFLGSDNLNTPRSVTAGDNFSIAIGDVDISLGAVAA